ncbi:MAG TPA: hypothetical protein VNX21_08335 [Candidatus Thermoplasmatota archaeon]|nr:hypothetical protein [Candidatus Thermoplasmatota archaeon]
MPDASTAMPRLACLATLALLLLAAPPAAAHVDPLMTQWEDCQGAFPFESSTLHVHRVGSRACSNLRPLPDALP